MRSLTHQMSRSTITNSSECLRTSVSHWILSTVDRSTHNSTTEMSQMLVRFTVKRTSITQTSVRLNVSECEFHTLVHGIAHGLGLHVFLLDLGIDLSMVIESDGNSASSFTNRQLHVQKRYLWFKDRVAADNFVIQRVPTTNNVTDILTKALDRKTLNKDQEVVGFVGIVQSKLHKRS